MARLSVIIVNWNSSEVLRDCVKSLYATVKNEMEIIVVDNHSSDDSIAVIKREFPGVILLEENNNLGFSKGNNAGFGRSRGEYILILNPDTVVLDDAVDRMVKFLETHPNVGILGPKMYEADGHTISLICKGRLPNLWNDMPYLFLYGKIFKWLNRKLSRYALFRKKFYAYYDRTEECEFIPGTCMLLRRGAYEKFNGFDESIPLYLDDIDLCYRSIKYGFKNMYIAEAQIIHLGRYSTKKSEKEKTFDLLILQARLFYYKLHFGPAKAALYKAMIFVSIPYLLILDILTLPFFIFKKETETAFKTFKKHLRYIELVLYEKVTGAGI